MARPRKPVDEELLKKLAMIQCTNEEIATIIGVSVDTIERRFAGILKEGRENGRMSIKRKQFEVAMGGNVGMLIWLGKQHCGQRDKHDVVEDSKKEVVTNVYVTEWGNTSEPKDEAGS